MRWTVHLDGGPRRVNHAAVSVNESIFSFGGYCTGEDYKVKRPMDVHILNTSNYRWTALPVTRDYEGNRNIPFQRYGHTAVAHDDKVYVWGGRNDRTACNILYCFDTATLTWSRPKVSGVKPGSRDGHSACVINNHMYIFGGFEELIERFSCDVHALNLTTMEWQYIFPSKGVTPSYRDFHSATAIGDRMYVFGGRGDIHGPYHSQEEFYCNKIVYFDTRRNQWVEPAVSNEFPSVGRRSHSAFEYKGKLFVFGGYNSLHNQHYNDFYCFDPVTNAWTVVGAFGMTPCERRRQSCCVVSDKMFLFGGTSPSPNDDNQPIITDPDGVLQEQLYDHNDLHILDLSPSLHTLCLLKVLEYGLDQECLPNVIRWELSSMTTHNRISRSSNNNNVQG